MKIIRHPLFMTPSPESELEQAIDRALRALPERAAPPTLIPRVMEAIARRQALPWWRKSFGFWPVGARMGFLALTTSLAALLLYFGAGLSVGASLGALTDEAAQLVALLDGVWSLATALGGAAVALARSAGGWFLWGAAAVAGACYLTTLALGTYCYRLAAQRI